MDWKNHLTPNEGGELERAQIARDAARAAYNDERLRLKWKGETRARRRAPPGARASWRSELSEADLALLARCEAVRDDAQARFDAFRRRLKNRAEARRRRAAGNGARSV